jgi:alkaline phosphatase D
VARLGRRTFIVGGAAAAGLLACGDDGGDDGDRDGGGGGTGGSTDADDTSTAPAPRPAPDLGGDPFTLGVASGDPLPDRVILWTRLAPDPSSAGGGMPDDDVDVLWEVATDEGFTDVVAAGVATATRDLAHAVHVDAGGLDPATTYRYRFTVGEFTSAVGTTRTFPAGDAAPERFRFVVASCQDLQFGRYGAWRAAADEPDVDAVLFLGDYVYELEPVDASPEQDGSRTWRNGPPLDLAGYRIRYAQVKEDASLQAAHHAAPWLVVWDDHEVTDNYTGDTSYADPEPVAFRAQRLAAYQAWYEHMPVRIDSPLDEIAGGGLRVHRSFRFGDLLTMPLIDTRQFADPTPCRETSVLDRGPDCPERSDSERTLLGAEQEEWLFGELQAADTTWTVLGNPVMLAGYDATGGQGAPEYYLESWDGYVAERARLLDVLDGLAAPVVLTGDFHASFVLDAKRAAGGDTVVAEFLVTGISSLPFEATTAGNPHVRYAEAGNGYLVCDVTASEWRSEFKFVTDVWDAESPVETRATFVLAPGDREARPA